MRVSRSEFMNQFCATIQVRVLPYWPLRSKVWPQLVPGFLYRSMTTCNGRFPIKLEQFHAIMERPLIELWQGMPRTDRPTPEAMTDFVYDVCSRAGIEIGIGEPVESHGHKIP
jgi:hypothetical protein